MDEEEEARAVDDVAKRLSEKFPGVPPDHVRDVVAAEAEQLDGNPIRDFVPVLVEHEARDQLRAEGATIVPVVPVETEEGPPNFDRA